MTRANPAAPTTLRPLAVSVRDAARLLAVSPRTVWLLIRRGRLRVVRLGRRSIVPVSEIERLLAPDTAG